MIVEAIKRLRPGKDFTLAGRALQGLTFLDPAVPEITPLEMDAMLLVLQAEQDASAYRARRAAEYPPVGDQLDDLFKRGACSPEMTARIQAVKDKYPKPSSL